MSDTIDLSITIVSYNTLDLTRRCLQSIKVNTKRIKYEIWVVDNNSTDGSADMIAREFPDVYLIRNSENKGLAAATNQGLERSKGRYLMSLNSDTVVMPEAFDRLVQFMDEHPEVGAAIPKLVLPGGGKHPVFCGNPPTLKTELLGALAPLHRLIAEAALRSRYGQEVDLSQSQEVSCILWGTALIVRREIVEEIGLQDPCFFVYAEDVDWVMRIRKAGWKLYYVAEAEVVHYGGQSTKQASTRMLAQIHKSKCRLIQKHYGFLAGAILRAAYTVVWGLRLGKWVIVYLLNKQKREQARDRIVAIRAILVAVITY
jgi:GT2 family glycosyltransferase